MSGIVQSAKGNNISNVNTVSKAYAGAVASGNSLIAIVATNGLPTNTFSLSDSVNGSWLAADLSNAGVGNVAVGIFRLQTTGAGTPTVTANMTGTAGPMFLTIWEVNGFASSPLDQTAQVATAGGAVQKAGPTGTTAQANELWVGVVALESNSGGALTASGSWTLDQTNDNFLGTEFQVVAAVGTATSGFLIGGSNGATPGQQLVATYLLGGGGTSMGRLTYILP